MLLHHACLIKVTESSWAKRRRHKWKGIITKGQERDRLPVAHLLFAAVVVGTSGTDTTVQRNFGIRRLELLGQSCSGAHL